MDLNEKVERFNQDKKEEKERFDKLMEEMSSFLKKKPIVTKDNKGHWKVSKGDIGDKATPYPTR